MSTGHTTQTIIGGEQSHDYEPDLPKHVNGVAAILWEVGADPRIDDDDELEEAYRRCKQRGLFDRGDEK